MMLLDEIIENPFPGLRPFEEEEDYLFFGREKQIDELLKKLRQTRFLAVVGSSGSGKSSLIKCGLIPALYGGQMSGMSAHWQIVVFRPGNDPIGHMSSALSQSEIFENDEIDVGTQGAIIEATLRRSDMGLVEVVKSAPQDHSNKNYLILVDQFEELFRFNQIEKEQNRPQRDSKSFINLLLAAISQSDVNIFIGFTMRSEFLGECTEFRGLPEAINKGQYLVPRLTREELKDTILGPIAVSGCELSDRLLNRLLNDVGENQDQLPILQHALMRTWEHWNAKTNHDSLLDLNNYLAIGSMTHALSQHAEEAFAELNNSYERETCEKIFRALTEKNKGNQGIRRPLRLDKLIEVTSSERETVVKILDIFRAKGRSFVVPSVDETLEDHSIIDISHESFMRVWTRLIEWVDEEGESSSIYLKLCESSTQFQHGLTSPWVDPELQMAINWKANVKPNLTWAKRYHPAFEKAMEFLTYCENERNQEVKKKEYAQQQKIKRTRIISVVLGSAMLITFAFAMISVSLKFKADENAQEAEVQRHKALKEKQIAEEQKQHAEIQRQLAYEQKQLAIQNQNLAEDRQKEAHVLRLQAEIEKSNAMHQKNLANSAKESAEQSRLVAEQQKEQALNERKIADSLKVIAEKAEIKSIQLRMLDIARKLAAFSLSINEETPDFASSLALLAYKFNQSNLGNPHEPVIYEALSDVAENTITLADGESYRSIKNLDNGMLLCLHENGSIDQLEENSSTITTLFSSSVDQARSLHVFGKLLLVKNAHGQLWIKNISDSSAPILTKASSNIIAYRDQLMYMSGNELIIRDKQSAQLIQSHNIPSAIKLIEIDDKGTLYLIDGENKMYTYIQSNKELKEFRTLSKNAVAMDINHGPSHLAVAYASGHLEIFYLLEGTSEQIHPHRSKINSIEFSQDGQFILTSSFDNTVKLINLHLLKQEPIIIDQSKDWVWEALYADNEHHIMVVSNDQRISMHETRASLLAKELCSSNNRPLTEDEWSSYIGNDIDRIDPCK